MGISFDFSSFGYWDVSLPQVRSPQGNIYLYMLGCPIRKSSDQSSLAAPRSFSQAYTSFIASDCQGIHHVHLITWPPKTNDKGVTRCFREYFSVGPSLGRPKWDIKMQDPPSERIFFKVGKVALIRVSSVISNRSFNGTLKSTRMSAFFPWKSNESSVCMYDRNWLNELGEPQTNIRPLTFSPAFLRRFLWVSRHNPMNHPII